MNNNVVRPSSPKSKWIAENIDNSLQRVRERDASNYKPPVIKSRAVTEPTIGSPLNKSVRAHTDRLHNINDLHRIGTYYNESKDSSVDGRRRISTDFDIKTVLQHEKVPSRQSRLASGKNSVFNSSNSKKSSLMYSSSPSMVLQSPLPDEYLKKLYLLHIHVIEATNLKVCDANGKSDPFLRLNFGSVKYRTRTIPHDLYPTFNQYFTFPVLDLIDDDKLSIIAWDRDSFSANDFLGSVEIKITELLHVPSWREQAWFPFYTKNYAKKSFGQLHLKMALVEWKESEESLLNLVSESPRLIASQQQEALSFTVENDNDMQISLATASWNMDFQQPPENLMPWLQLSNPDGSDILAVAVQKCGYKPRYPFKTTAADWLGTLSQNCGPHYHLIAYESVHYTRLAIYAHSRCVDAITNVEKATKKFSIINDYGTVAISFIIGHLKWCFLSTLVDPNSESIPYRNSQINDTIKTLNLGAEKLDILSQFHHVFWMGDFGAFKLHNKGDGFEADSIYNAQLVGDIFPNFNDTIKSRMSPNTPVHEQYNTRIMTHFMDGYDRLVVNRVCALANQVINEGDYFPVIAVFDVNLIDLPSSYDNRVGECSIRILQLEMKTNQRMKKFDDSLYFVINGSMLNNSVNTELLEATNEAYAKTEADLNSNSSINNNNNNNNNNNDNNNNEQNEESREKIYNWEDSQIPDIRLKDGFNSKSRLKYEWLLFKLQSSRSSNKKVRILSDPILGTARIAFHQVATAAILHDKIFSRWCLHFKFNVPIYFDGVEVGSINGVCQIFWRELAPPKIVEPLVNYTSSVITGHVNADSSEDVSENSDSRQSQRLSSISTIMKAVGLLKNRRKRHQKRAQPSKNGNIGRIKGLRAELSRRINLRKQRLSSIHRKVSKISAISELSDENNTSTDTLSLSYSKFDDKSLTSNPLTLSSSSDTTNTTVNMNMRNDDHLSYNFKQSLVTNISEYIIELVKQRKELGANNSLALFLTQSSYDKLLVENWTKTLKDMENVEDIISTKELLTLLLDNLELEIKKRNGWMRSRVAQSVDLGNSSSSSNHWKTLSKFVAQLSEDESVLEDIDSESDEDYEHEKKEEDVIPTNNKIPFPYNSMKEYLTAKNNNKS